MNRKDDIVEEARATREAFAAEFGYDMRRMYEYIKQREAQDPTPRADLQPSLPTQDQFAS